MNISVRILRSPRRSFRKCYSQIGVSSESVGEAFTKILKLQTPKLTSVHGLCNIADVFMTFI
jgi:hypothetical protein